MSNDTFQFEGEVWVDVVGWEGKYKVSESGKIISVNYRLAGSPKILRQQPDKDGYLNISFCRNGKQKVVKVSRIVASAFHENPLNLPEVNHEDGVKTNNEKTNLRWCTRAYNIQHSFDTFLRPRTTEKQRAAVLITNSLKRGTKYKKAV